MNLEVKTSKLQFVALAVLAVIMLPLIAFALYRGVTGPNFVMLTLGLVSMTVIAVVIFFMRRGYSNSVRTFSDTGIRRNDGTELLWADLIKVVDQIRHEQGRTFIWRTEIHFRGDRCAWVIPSKIGNYPEVRVLVDGLDCEHLNG